MSKNPVASNRKESGQVLVLFAMALIGVTAMLALVIDGGNLYLQRRRMQNAADAAALAVVARMAELGGDDCHDAEYYALLTEYAITRNGADEVEALYLPDANWYVGGG